jgi:hypothetical protein
MRCYPAFFFGGLSVGRKHNAIATGNHVGHVILRTFGVEKTSFVHKVMDRLPVVQDNEGPWTELQGEDAIVLISPFLESGRILVSKAIPVDNIGMKMYFLYRGIW